MNNSQFNERNVSCAAAAVQASSNSTSRCFGSKDHTSSACFLICTPSQLPSSPFSACLQERLALWKKSKHRQERLQVLWGMTTQGSSLFSLEAFKQGQHLLKTNAYIHKYYAEERFLSWDIQELRHAGGCWNLHLWEVAAVTSESDRLCCQQLVTDKSFPSRKGCCSIQEGRNQTAPLPPTHIQMEF